MADSETVLLSEELMAEIMVFVSHAPHPHPAFCALIGAAVGACYGQLTVREMAEALWRLGDHTVERGDERS